MCVSYILYNNVALNLNNKILWFLLFLVVLIIFTMKKSRNNNVLLIAKSLRQYSLTSLIFDKHCVCKLYLNIIWVYTKALSIHIGLFNDRCFLYCVDYCCFCQCKSD
jgi:hypothetical protein